MEVPHWLLTIVRLLSAMACVGLVFVSFWGIKDGLEAFDHNTGVSMFIESLYLL